MPYIIYIKSTKQVVGRVQKETAIKGEIRNLVNSELGGATDDYGVTPNVSNKEAGTMYVITRDGSAELTPNPIIQAQEAARASGQARLLAWVMPQEEIDASPTQDGAVPGSFKYWDANGDGEVANILDLTYLVDRIFRGGPTPGSC